MLELLHIVDDKLFYGERAVTVVLTLLKEIGVYLSIYFEKVQ